MMQLKKGDIVSFIDEKLEGVVRHVDHNGNVHVETSDGFNLQVSPKELVKTGELKTEQNTSDEVDSPELIKENEHIVSTLPSIEGLYFLAEAFEENKVLTGKVRLTLANATRGEAYFSINKKEAKPFKTMHGHISRHSSVIIDEFLREDWINHQHFNIQCIIYDKDDFIPALRKDIAIAMPGLNDVIKTKAGSNIYATQKSIFKYSVEDKTDMSDLILKYKPGETTDPGTRSIKRSEIRPDPLNNKTTFDRVVDLHIEELVDHLDGLTSDAMLEIQINHFQRELNRALQDHCYKITFIHGVGKGILKSRIREELEKYPEFKFNDADAMTFGSGATEIILS